MSAKASKALDTMRARIVKADEVRAAQVAEATTTNQRLSPRRRAGRTHPLPLGAQRPQEPRPPVGLEFRIRSLNRGLGHQCVAPEF